jgi:hypothetical protein
MMMKRIQPGLVAIVTGLSTMTSLAAEAADKPSFEQYLNQYFIGHYSPRGNHFFAYSIKDAVVKGLDPKPITYRQPDPHSIDFKGYLPDSPRRNESAR